MKQTLAITALTLAGLMAPVHAQVQTAATGQAGLPTASRASSLLLSTPADISRLKQDSRTTSQLLWECERGLGMAPRPVRVLANAPHYNSSGVNPDSPKLTLAEDAPRAYRAALCYQLSQDMRFARHAQQILDAWAGQLTSIQTSQAKADINFNLPNMIIAASWVKGAGDWKSGQFDRFLRQVILPVSLSGHPRNHGFWGILMETSAAVYLNDTSRLARMRVRWHALLNESIGADGRLTEEIERSGTSNWRGGPDKGKRGLSYTHYALLPATMSAQIMSNAGYPGIWHSNAGKQLQRAFVRAAAWTNRPATFPFYASNQGQLEGVNNVAYFKVLVRHYPNADASAVLGRERIGLNGFKLLELF